MAAFPAAEDDSFMFTPSDRRLVDILRAKIGGGDFPNAAYFVDNDVCSVRPEELVRKHSKPARVRSREAGDGRQFYFFSPESFVSTRTKKQRKRTIDGTSGNECWHGEGSGKLVGGTNDGYMTKFSFHIKIAGETVAKPGWLMTEYSLKGTGAGGWVLCKIYKSPRGPGRSKAPSSLENKRKAADDLEDARPSTKERRQDQIDANGALEGDLPLPSDDLPSVNPAVQTVYGALTDGEVIDALASGVTVDELIPSTTEDRQPEPHVLPASFDALMHMMHCPLGVWEVPNGMRTEAFEAYRGLFGSTCDVVNAQNNATVQTGPGALTDGGVVAAHASGATIDELIPSTTNERQPESQVLFEDDGMPFQVPEFVDTHTHFMGLIFGKN